MTERGIGGAVPFCCTRLIHIYRTGVMEWGIKIFLAGAADTTTAVVHGHRRCGVWNLKSIRCIVAFVTARTRSFCWYYPTKLTIIIVMIVMILAIFTDGVGLCSLLKVKRRFYEQSGLLGEFFSFYYLYINHNHDRS